jgi:hypothetical protein
MLVKDFISAIIQHIPEKNQKLVRYYGVYSRRKKSSIQSTITSLFPLKCSERGVAYCPICHERMEFMHYAKKPPPKDKNKITNWLEV